MIGSESPNCAIIAQTFNQKQGANTDAWMDTLAGSISRKRPHTVSTSSPERMATMKVILDIDERYARALCITAINNDDVAREVNVTTACCDLENGQFLRIDRTGQVHQTKVREDTNNG